MRVFSGQLDRRITIYSVSNTNSFGAKQKVDTSLGTFAAKYTPKFVNEVYDKDMITAVADAEFIVRYNSVTATIKVKDAIVFEGNRYELISAPVQLGRREYLALKVRLLDAAK